jgi:hypothetical protein
MALNEPPADGIRVRRAIGTELSSPPGPVNCTDSGASPGVRGMATARGTLAELSAGMVTGADAGSVVKSWPLAWKVTVPV